MNRVLVLWVGLVLAAASLAQAGVLTPEVKAKVAQAWQPRLLVRVHLNSPQDIVALEDMALDFATLRVADHAEVVVTPGELAEIRRRGFRTEVIQREEDVLPIPPDYHTVDETWVTLDSLHRLYPGITKLDTCGYSHRFRLPIPRFVISRNVGMREDEAAALLTGMTHAREPIGNEICLYTIQWILRNYPDSARARRYVDSMDLHFVPITNPEGFKYITDSSLVNPWWRKNLRDNANNGGPIDPNYDGVDLNRNYNWRWTSGGSTDPANWTYRGPSPASESEIQALVTLATQRKYVVGISYHSYGYQILYPLSFSGRYAPDDATLTEIAQNLGTQIGGYAPSRLGGSNQSSVWFYGQLGMYDFLIETARSFIPSPESIAIESQKNFRGLTYLLDRSFRSGVTGHVRDSLTLQPLLATVEVTGLTGDSIVPRTSDSLYGRFYRLLRNGTYTMRFSKTGYIPKTISNITTTSDSLTKLEVLLARISGAEGEERAGGSGQRIGAWPNPMREQCMIYAGPEQVLTLYDLTGSRVRRLTREAGKSAFHWDGKKASGERVSSGVYFYRVEGESYKATQRVVLLR